MTANFSPGPGVLEENEADQTLVERYRHGDREAFAAIVVRYQRPVYNAAWWVLRNAEDARDVAQVVFMKVAERLDEYDPRYRFFSWIYRIAVNEALNVLRRNDREERSTRTSRWPARKATTRNGASARRRPTAVSATR
jgi:RNA polymerase sigma-70 factor (ECF subfamily)